MAQRVGEREKADHGSVSSTSVFCRRKRSRRHSCGFYDAAERISVVDPHDLADRIPGVLRDPGEDAEIRYVDRTVRPGSEAARNHQRSYTKLRAGARRAVGVHGNPNDLA